MGAVCSSATNRHGVLRRTSHQQATMPPTEASIIAANHNPEFKRHSTNTPIHDLDDAKSDSSSDSSQPFTPIPGFNSQKPCHTQAQRSPGSLVAEPEVIKLPCLKKLPSYVSRRVCGRLLKEKVASNMNQQEDKVIRMYHIAHLTDSHEERDLLLERVYPALQLFALEHGFDLDVIDLHWGQRDPYVTLGNIGVPPWLYLRSLLEVDNSVLVVVFLNEKYGTYGSPSAIAQEHLSPILNTLMGKDKEIIERWYCLDENSMPAEYVLQPISAHLTNYGSSNDEEHRKACSHWSATSDKIGDILWKCSDKEFQDLYIKSELERELDESVFSDGFPADNVLLVRRTFRNKGLKGASPQHLAEYTDIRMGKPDKLAQTRLNNLANRLNDKVEPSNRLELEVGWHSGTLSREVTEHVRYAQVLCSRYKEMLRGAIEKIMEIKAVYDRVRINMVGAGMQKYMYDDILHHTIMCQDLSRDVIERDDVFAQLRNYVTDGHPTGFSQHVQPLFLVGPTGSGKSTMAAALAIRSCTMVGWTKSLCIMRHVGCSPGCGSLDEMLASISAHVCFLFGLPYSYAHKPVSMFPASFSQLLRCVPKSTPLVIVLDGFDLLNQHSNMSWLPEELPAHVRLIITVTEGTSAHVMLMNLPWQNESYSISIPELSVPCVLTMMQNHLSVHRRQLVGNQREMLEDAITANPNPLYIKLATMMTLRWSSDTEKDDLYLGSSIKDLLRKSLLLWLEHCHGDEPVGRLLTYLSVLEEGVSDTEIKDMLSLDEGFLLPVYMHADVVVRRAPAYIWVDIMTFLQDCLLKVTSISGSGLTKWRHRIFQEVVLDVCRCYESVTWMKVLDYYEGRWANGKRMPFASHKEGIEVRLCDRLVKHQPIKYQSSYNQRKLEQISMCLIQNDMFKPLKDEFLLNLENLTHMLSALTVYRVLYSLRLYLDAEQADEDVHFMYDLIRQNASVVCQRSDSLWSQFYLRVLMGKLGVSKKPAIQKLFTGVSSGILRDREICAPFLIPSTSSVLDIQDPTQLKPQTVISGLYTIPTERNHVISISTEEGNIIVWNIHHQVPVRTLSNILQPKSLKMIDSSRSVVLCNRELRIYNLEEGKEECQLKGVLNLKMPYFGVLDSEHTVTLSRNRMYVNIINNSTGDMEATFKVGEDRFLDSLIMSANGEWCVCGDQVQKPFPLLVWNLVNRKLVHDMRITGHEFVTRMAAITAEGHYVVCVCRSASPPLSRYSIIERVIGYTEEAKDKSLAEPNFLIVYDLQSGSLFKKWKPDYSTTSVHISSASNLVVSGHEDGSLHIWDLIGGALKYQLAGHTRGPDHLSVSEDGERAASCDLTCTDTSVYLWDLDKGLCLGSFVTEYGVTCCEVSLDGSVVIIGIPGSEKIICLWATKDDRDKSKMDISIYGDASRNKLSFTMED